jgi:flagellar FliJ protein
MEAALRSLLTVRGREREHRDGAMLALREAERRLAQILAQGHTLQNYRQDAAGRWAVPLGRLTTTPQLHTARNFLQRLDGALLQQDHEERRLRTLVQQRRTALLAAETRLASVDQLIQRRRQAHLTRLQHREQRADDERAQAMGAANAATAAYDAHDQPDDPQA